MGAISNGNRMVEARSPSWFKLEFTLLAAFQFMALAVAAKGWFA